MTYLLFDDTKVQNFLPLTFTRPMSDLRIGIDKISEKWEAFLNENLGILTIDYLQDRFEKISENVSDTLILINARAIPNQKIVEEIKTLTENKALVDEKSNIIAAHLEKAFVFEKKSQLFDTEEIHSKAKNVKTASTKVLVLENVTDIFTHNSEVLKQDFERITANRETCGIQDKHTIIYGEENIFVEEGAKIRAAIINAENGPIYIGKNVQIQEAAIIHGAHALCENSVVNVGAKLRGDSTIGPFSKIGGEVSNSVIQGFSNKGHDGFLGNSVLGYWCNLGADTNTSNLKNNYANVKIWNYQAKRFLDTGKQFTGLIMGDHSKSGINTMFNTGTVVGVSANIFGSGFPRNFIPSFSWGGYAGFKTYLTKKAFEVAELVMMRRKKVFDKQEQEILEAVFERTKENRFWEGKNENN